ncbi:MAG: hypothetical protein WAM85_04500 [Terracidiphilus sp.]
MNVLPEALEKLTSRVDALEKRVHDLEHPSEAFASSATQVSNLPPAPEITEESPIEQVGSVFPVLGGAMLGIAGAYVLRALAESGLVPRQAIAAVAIVYAVAWLVWSAKARATAPFARAIYAGTSALILAPMLWELVLRFNILSPVLTAVVLSGFAVAATALAWKDNLTAVLWIANGAAALTSLALAIATHQLMPFLFALLVMVLLCEYAVVRGRGQSIRPLVAAVADVAVWALIFIYSSPESAHTDYPALGPAVLLSPACLLFLIYAVSLVFKTTILERSITVFEIVQGVIAFILVISSVLFFEPNTGTVILGIACLLLSAACYWLAFAAFRPASEHRNFNVFAAWGAALFLAGVLWSLPSAWAGMFLGLAALTAIVLGVRRQCTALDFHGVIYLFAAAVVSGLLEYSFRALAGPPTAQPSWSIFLISACAISSYAAGKERKGEDWRQQLLHFIPALLAACAVTALMAQGLLRLAAFVVTPDVFHVALIRTLAICSVALALAFGGARWGRLEMTRIAYSALVFEAAKLLFEDLRHGRMEFIAASFFLFAVTLIGVPRLTHMRHKI